jgi:hypothetical protein
MDKISTISDTTISDTTISDPARAHSNRGNATDVCWCGQDMDGVRGRHCPRCGTARATRCDAALTRLAARGEHHEHHGDHPLIQDSSPRPSRQPPSCRSSPLLWERRSPDPRLDTPDPGHVAGASRS